MQKKGHKAHHGTATGRSEVFGWEQICHGYFPSSKLCLDCLNFSSLGDM